MPVGNTDLLMSFDTSTLMYCLGIQNLRNQKEMKEAEFVQGLIPDLSSKKKVLFKTSASQVEEQVMRSMDMPNSRKKRIEFGDTKMERLDTINGKMEALGFEDYTNRIGDYKDNLDLIEKRQKWMLNNPHTSHAKDWIHRKCGHRCNMQSMTSNERRNILRELCRKAKSGGDNRLLAQAATLAEDYDVIFVSNDGDHTTLDEYMETITRGRLRVMYPVDVSEYLAKSGRNFNSTG